MSPLRCVRPSPSPVRRRVKHRRRSLRFLGRLDVHGGRSFRHCRQALCRRFRRLRCGWRAWRRRWTRKGLWRLRWTRRRSTWQGSRRQWTCRGSTLWRQLTRWPAARRRRGRRLRMRRLLACTGRRVHDDPRRRRRSRCSHRDWSALGGPLPVQLPQSADVGVQLGDVRRHQHPLRHCHVHILQQPVEQDRLGVEADLLVQL